MRISRLNTWVPGAPASVSDPRGCCSARPAEGGSLPLPVPPCCPFDGR
jgi:hypothetical protein